jgi:hypothetical protein
MSLTEIKQLIKEKGVTPRLNKDSMMKELVWDDQWIGYDDEETHEMKRSFANNLCFGGTMAWSVDFYAGDEMEVKRPYPQMDAAVLDSAALFVLAAASANVVQLEVGAEVPRLIATRAAKAVNVQLPARQQMVLAALLMGARLAACGLKAIVVPHPVSVATVMAIVATDARVEAASTLRVVVVARVQFMSILRSGRTRKWCPLSNVTHLASTSFRNAHWALLQQSRSTLSPRLSSVGHSRRQHGP